jgi:predicted nucleic acid-binding protein
MRIVLDTNIFVSGVIGGKLGIILDEWKRGKFNLAIIKSDPTDNKFLEAAIAGNAETIISGDHQRSSVFRLAGRAVNPCWHL